MLYKDPNCWVWPQTKIKVKLCLSNDLFTNKSGAFCSDFSSILDQLFVLLFAYFCQINASFHWYFIMRKRSILLEPTNQDSGETIRVVKVKRNKHEKLVSLSHGNIANGRKHENNGKKGKKNNYFEEITSILY